MTHSDMLNDLIATSTSTPKRSMIADLDTLSSMLHDMCDEWGTLTIANYVTRWTKGRMKIDARKQGETI